MFSCSQGLLGAELRHRDLDRFAQQRTRDVHGLRLAAAGGKYSIWSRNQVEKCMIRIAYDTQIDTIAKSPLPHEASTLLHDGLQVHEVVDVRLGGRHATPGAQVVHHAAGEVVLAHLALHDALLQRSCGRLKDERASQWPVWQHEPIPTTLTRLAWLYLFT